MGYTQYWYQPTRIDEAEWQVISEAATDMLRAPHAGRMTVTSDMVRVDGECESFVFPRVVAKPLYKGQDTRQGFVKTRGFPYDATVVALLKAFREVLGPRLELNSDGGDEVFAHEFTFDGRRSDDGCRLCGDIVAAHEG